MRWIKYSITVIMSRLMLQCVDLQISSKLIYEDLMELYLQPNSISFSSSLI